MDSETKIPIEVIFVIDKLWCIKICTKENVVDLPPEHVVIINRAGRQFSDKATKVLVGDSVVFA